MRRVHRRGPHPQRLPVVGRPSPVGLPWLVGGALSSPCLPAVTLRPWRGLQTRPHSSFAPRWTTRSSASRRAPHLRAACMAWASQTLAKDPRPPFVFHCGQMVFVLLPLAIEYARTSVTPEAACGFLGMCGGDAITLPSAAAQVGARLVGGHACMQVLL